MELQSIQDFVDEKVVTRMVFDFYKEFKDVYTRSVFESSLCSVGPLQAMIGLAIKNGHLVEVHQGGVDQDD